MGAGNSGGELRAGKMVRPIIGTPVLQRVSLGPNWHVPLKLF